MARPLLEVEDEQVCRSRRSSSSCSSSSNSIVVVLVVVVVALVVVAAVKVVVVVVARYTHPLSPNTDQINAVQCLSTHFRPPKPRQSIGLGDSSPNPRSNVGFIKNSGP
jgi:flagellar biosynthesis protein FlhB